MSIIYRGFFSLLLLVLLAACARQATPVEVVIESQILGTALGIQAVSVEVSEEIGAADFDGYPFSYFNDQLIVKLSGNETMTSFLSRFGGTLLNDGSIPAPPETVDPSKVRKVDDLGYRLVSVTVPVADNAKLAQKLEKKGFKGKAKFSNQKSANLFDLYLRINDKEFGEGISVEPNILIQPTAYREQRMQDGTSSTGPFYNPENSWWFDERTSRVSYNDDGTGGAWALKDALNRPIDGRGSTIAIIDGGFNRNSYDIVGIDPYSSTSVVTRRISTYNFVGQTYNVPINADCASGICWHGHGAALVAAGARDNRFGYVGVAPNANLFLFRMYDAGSGATPIGLDGWYNAGWAVDTATAWAADVISMSFLAYTPGGVGIPGTYLGAAIDRADDAGVINVAAMGNDERYFNGGRWPWVTYPIPAIWDDVLSVGAINPSRGKSSYSNWGTDVDIWAPAGENSNPIRVAPHPDLWCYDILGNHQCKYTAANDMWDGFNGTSAATPFVAGVIALMKQMDPTLTPDEIESILKRTARTDSPTPDIVPRVVDARRAVIITRNER